MATGARALACDEQRVAVGMGNPARVWRLTGTEAEALQHVWHDDDDLVGNAESAYSAATYEDLDDGVPYPLSGLSGTDASLLVVENASVDGVVVA